MVRKEPILKEIGIIYLPGLSTQQKFMLDMPILRFLCSRTGTALKYSNTIFC